MTQVMSLRQVATQLHVNERTIVNLVRDGALAGFKVGKNWRFEASDVEAYVVKQKANAPREEERSTDGNRKTVEL